MIVYKINSLKLRPDPDFSVRSTEAAQAFIDNYNDDEQSGIFVPLENVGGILGNEGSLRSQIVQYFLERCQVNQVRPELIRVEYAQTTLGKHGRISTAWFISGSGEFYLT